MVIYDVIEYNNRGAINYFRGAINSVRPVRSIELLNRRQNLGFEPV